MDIINFLTSFFSLDNPILYGLLITGYLMLAIVLINKRFISPLTKKKKELEFKNAKLAALFSEIDPDPILRINKDLQVVDMNNAAKKEFGKTIEKDNDVHILIPNYEDYLDGEFDVNKWTLEINDKFYTIDIRDVPELDFKQVYLNDISLRVKYEEQIKEYQVSLRKLRARFDMVNEEERQRLGQELHDGVGQNISLLKIKLSNTPFNSENKKAVEEVKIMLKTLDQLQSEVRDISHQLRPRVLNEFGLISAITSMIANINENGNLEGFFTKNGSEKFLGKEIELNIYRICQEATNNIIKHSNAKSFFINLFYEENLVKLLISDDGEGFNVDEYLSLENSSLGLLNMKERALTVEGNFEIESAPGQGTTVYVDFPLARIEEEKEQEEDDD